MAQIRCDYCGNYIEDSDLKCRYCGAPNDNLKRTADGTPKTIEELKDWYRARNLPDESVTRFFIGKNITEPKAFGIYEHNGNFVVYKNKADGSRAVRYEGKDEAYAVKELYLRLKEEILDQKARQGNANARSVPSRSAPSGRVTAGNQPKKKGFRAGCLAPILIVIALFSSCVAIFSHYDDTHSQSGKYYISEDGSLYYSYGTSTDENGNSAYEWWKYDADSGEWSVSDRLESNKEFPDGVEGTDDCYLSDIKDRFGKTESELSIFNSRNYIDAGHHYRPNTDYYLYNGSLYYYNYDPHGASYGNGDTSGWYKYDDDAGWTYYCSYDDKETLGEDLWYDEDSYSLGSTVSHDDWYNATGNEKWETDSFENTSWYKDTQSATKAYDKEVERQKAEQEKEKESKSSWSSDSSYDWDSGSSWDSGSTDWSSDWFAVPWLLTA